MPKFSSMMYDYVIFNLGKSTFAFNLDYVARVIPSVKVVLIPGVPKYLDGVINLSGEILPSINLFEKFGINASHLKVDQKYLIIQSCASKYALLIDSVESVVHCEGKSLIKPEKIIKGLERYVERVVEIENKPIPVFDIEKLLTETELDLIQNEVKKHNEY